MIKLKSSGHLDQGYLAHPYKYFKQQIKFHFLQAYAKQIISAIWFSFSAFLSKCLLQANEYQQQTMQMLTFTFKIIGIFLNYSHAIHSLFLLLLLYFIVWSSFYFWSYHSVRFASFLFSFSGNHYLVLFNFVQSFLTAFVLLVIGMEMQ